ncbi:MAG: GAF domain-containing sensor histidine kinase [Gemmatimonadetes bacterium]|nr:GAF domain-containing sensor histidine kinase [Gemmatimonadota bacterium]
MAPTGKREKGRSAARARAAGPADRVAGREAQSLEKRVAERTKWLTLLHNVALAINDAPSWDEGLRVALRHVCEAEKWQVGAVYLPGGAAAGHLEAAIRYAQDKRFRPFLLATGRMRFAWQPTFPGRAYFEGRPIWCDGREELLRALPMRAAEAKQVGLVAGAAFPIKVGKTTIAVLELFSDRPHRPTPELSSLMTDVSAQIGRVLEREQLTAQAADLVWREQQNLAHTLHDSLGQTLTGLGMLSATLSKRLAGADAEAAEMAREISNQGREALEQVRQVSRGLFAIQVDAGGLVTALRQLASTTEALHKIPVRVNNDLPVTVRDARVATQLYRIAQEAVTNVVKHAKAHTIRLEVGAESGWTRLYIIDDGVGIGTDVPKGGGLGLRIMGHRAASIGARLSIERWAGGGTVVRCTWREAPSPAVWNRLEAAAVDPGEGI